MSSFAPAYHQESNDANLDELLAYIVSRPRNVRSATYESGQEGHRCDGLSSEIPELDPCKLKIPQRQTSLRSSGSRLRTSSPWSWRSSSLSISSKGARSTLSHCDKDESQSHDSSVLTAVQSGHSQYSEAKAIERFNTENAYRQSHAQSTLSSPKTVTSGGNATKPSCTITDGQRKLIPRDDSRHGQYVRSSPSLSTIKSESSWTTEKFDFPPHPGVRPHAQTHGELGYASGAYDNDHDYPKSLALTLIIFGVCLSVFIISVNRNIVATAIPEITARFQSYQDIGWYGSSYLLTASAFQPLYGRIYMGFDTKWTYLTALAIFEMGSIICGASPTSAVLITGRAVQGLGSAGILTGSFVVCTHSVRLEKRPILFAGVGMLFGIGALSGPMLGGVLTDLATWRWCFYINVPVGSITFVAVILCFTPHRHEKSPQTPFFARLWQLDWIGNAILLGACTMLFLALQYSEERYSWSSARCIGLIIGFGITLIIFVLWMFWKGRDALIPVHIARQRTVAASCGAAFFIYGGLLLHSYYLPIWFQAVKGDSAIRSGVNMVPYMVINAFFSLFAGIFVSKNGRFAPPAIIGCMIGTIGSGLLATLKPDTSTAKWAGYEILVSAGLGMAVQQGFSAVQTALPLHEVPIGTAAVVACQSIGGAIFVSVGNTLLQNHLLDANNDGIIPGVNIRAVIELGATRFRSTIPPESLPALVALYNDSLQGALIAAVPLCGCAFLCSLCMEWRSVRNRQQTGTEIKA